MSYEVRSIFDQTPGGHARVLLSAEARKAGGVYYTDADVARFLCRWAIRRPEDAVLEPCLGGGVFLEAAFGRLRQLGAASPRVSGVDLDPGACAEAAGLWPDADITCSDFFDLDPAPVADAVVGNPPFVRYQRFAGHARRKAQRRVRDAGAVLTEMASAWAPFLIHATQFLKPGARMAMVAPAECLHSRYAQPVLEHLCGHFARCVALQFLEPMFPELNEATILLLAEGWGGRTEQLDVARLHSVRDLERQVPTPRTVRLTDLISGALSSRAVDLPSPVLDLYNELCASETAVRLGDVASVTIGYVTGDNDFFHPKDVGGLPPDALRTCVRKGADLTGAGLWLDDSDHRYLAAMRGRSLFQPRRPALDAAELAYIRSGEQSGVHLRYKCRVRTPWWQVPGVSVPDLFLSVFTSGMPRLVANRAGLIGTNSVLTVRLTRSDPDPRRLAAASISTLAQLSAEIEGHVLGGGALKFEPGEARRWVLPIVGDVPADALAGLDRLLRAKDVDGATDLADQIFLLRSPGCSADDVRAMRVGIRYLRGLRRARYAREEAAGVCSD